MAISKREFTEYIKSFKFKELFNYLGWDNDMTVTPVKLDEYTYILTCVAQKRGFRVMTCTPDANGKIPTYPERLKINNKVKKLFHDHLIIFLDSAKKEQLWQLIYNQKGQTKKSEIRYNTAQNPEKLYQRTSGLLFDLDDEDKITIIDVEELVKSNFGSNSEKVTKKFYDNFKKQHKALIEFIKGIDETLDKEWYASLMLNRLMFCYFIQKQGFLDGNKNYLREKLTQCKEKHGDDKFYSFYRQFLLVLFHKGLGGHDRNKILIDEIGNVPYLNGGLFDEHEIEKKYPEITINDDAFESIFDFFDEYDWHLDNRIAASGKDINPDVLGYIFEKYINDRAQMGAYYTQEDITEYISKNCIIPYLFEETKRHYEVPFKPDGFIWQMLKESGDQYIYDAVKKGVDLPLPPNIEIGVDTSKADLLQRRKDWNHPADEAYALPTEIWRETVERRQRYAKVHGKIQNGEIKDINDLITFNLNICQFAQDVIDNIDDPDFIRHFYKVLTSMTILDPTCGSGAFLFAAMNILEPLYEKCIIRMDNYCRDSHGKRYKYFEDELYKVESERHPNRQYFIFKSIILNNLYGVDIMNEAVETAKLRLFLKLVATVDPNPAKDNMGLEPLPDIDFNIKAGNTLVGYANETEMKDALEETFEGRAMKGDVLEKCLYVAKATQRYKEIQLCFDEDFKAFKDAKKELLVRQKQLNEILNKRLFEQYSSTDYKKWLETHQPLHWIAEYYDIIANHGGFNVIIGNPPYVEYNKAKSIYHVNNYLTENCGNLYAFVIERSKHLLSENNYSGMIIPHSAFCTDRMQTIMDLLEQNGLWISTYDIRPAKLFNGVDQRLAIYLSSSIIKKDMFTTQYIRWSEQLRPFLFMSFYYTRKPNIEYKNSIMKVGNPIVDSILQKLDKDPTIAVQKSSYKTIYYHNAPRYWIRATNFKPYFWNEKDGEKLSVQVKSLSFSSTKETIVAGCILNSSLFYLWFVLFSDCRHLNNREIDLFRCDLKNINSKRFLDLFEQLMDDIQNNKKRKTTFYKATGKVIYDEYYPRYSKSIIDEIDKLLAQYYGFTEQELDYIINYDIKYRMGSDTGDEE
ncbi:Eco57I restriction-modification methylase domain-containing protein [Caproiciproducens galactitolivorans]|uniref:site-specific DNA-methyltransferase (adenine-specific) n=1 Tax=Caproiciproducens galactitolivorans TaxID=642589 RepID=A0ABT4BUA5_9FIRM|nr:DNA methyltransferase [Caproiciproducens galactitolivorans]MCY1714482.1 Eco57I restriction-modification methylase domain-containing protein [Caproiciproducens galactitolivorans]